MRATIRLTSRERFTRGNPSARSSSAVRRKPPVLSRDEDYLRRSGLDIKLDHGVDSRLDALSLVRHAGLALMPAYAKNVLPWSVVSRPWRVKRPRSIWRGLQQGKHLGTILKLFSPGLRNCERPCPKPQLAPRDDSLP